ncbi:conserved hypothetical protein [Candidatus Sulfopaludibacter sp. SbA6]|nr:conserved hypothetical protein [Candidatus Sulfopaludibacter sp. SbA6]
MQRDAVYLADILSAAADLREFTRGASLDEFCSNKTLRYAMLHALTVIGEASSKVSAELKERYGEVPWQRVSGVRHRIVHDYSGLDYELLWQVVTVFAPELAEQVAAIFRAEFPGLDATGPEPGQGRLGS